ncbi:hypothetical protein ACNOYE_34725 [Nannocystaceae bacterium ST9]
MEGMIMDIGVNQAGYHWVVEDQHELGKGYVARLSRDGKATIAAREGFSTREGAVSWATSFDGSSRSFVAFILVGLGFVFTLGVVASLARAFTGVREVRVTTRFGHGRERDHEFDSRSRGGARARPSVR